MFTTKSARRYASALLQFSTEQNNAEEILEDIQLIRNTIDGSKELDLFLQSPVIKFDDKLNGLEDIFRERVQKTTWRFIALLARKNRIELLNQVTHAFNDQYNKQAGIIEVEVYTAEKLSDSQKKALHDALEEKTGKSVVMKLQVDESLKGGIAVRIDDTVIDGTIKHKLEQLQEKLLAKAAE